MSTHEVKIIKIDSIFPHTNSDNLEIIKIWGYQVVVRRNQFPVGSLAAYIESDYTVPLDRDEFKFLDDGKGKPRQRITMRRFRGEASYGLLIRAPEGSVEGDNVLELLGVERWEPAPAGGRHGGSAGFLSGMCDTGPNIPAATYDLEPYKRFHKFFEPGEEVIYTAKVHGCNGRYAFADGRMHYGSRTTWKKIPGEFIKNITYMDKEAGVEVTKDVLAPENAWFSAAQQNPWIEAWCRAHEGCVLYGEVYGPNIQGAQFCYGKNQGEYGFAAFDILDHGSWVNNVEMFDNPSYSNGIEETVLVLYRGPHNQDLIYKLAEEQENQERYPGQKVREGVVIKPVSERRMSHGERCALKHVSDRYLCL